MENRDDHLEALMLAHKFGFISKDIFWDFLSPDGISTKYKHWRRLCKSPFFSPYHSGSGVPEYLFLSAKGKQRMGQDAVTQTVDVYLAHDELVMRCYLHLKNESLMVNCWSESELKADRTLSIKSLGNGVVSKLPDLLFDVRGGTDTIRCALEVERTRKSQARYRAIRGAYAKASKVDLVLFGVSDPKIEEAITKEVITASGNTLGREMGFFDISDFTEQGLDSQLRIVGKETTLKKFFHSLAVKFQNSVEKS